MDWYDKLSQGHKNGLFQHPGIYGNFRAKPNPDYFQTISTLCICNLHV